MAAPPYPILPPPAPQEGQQSLTVGVGFGISPPSPNSCSFRAGPGRGAAGRGGSSIMAARLFHARRISVLVAGLLVVALSAAEAADQPPRPGEAPGAPPPAENKPDEEQLHAPRVRVVPAAPPAENKPDEEQIRRIVDQALKEEAEKRSREEAQARQEAAARGAPVGSNLGLFGLWNDGPYFETPIQDFRVGIHGRFDVDGAWFAAGERLQTGPGGVGELRDGADFRRARLRIDGTAYEIINWIAEFDFAFAQEGDTKHVGITDLYWDVTHLPLLGNFRVGHMREPFSMEALTSGLALPFMERSAAFDAFDPFRNTGMMLYNAGLNDRMTWAAGVFRTNSRNTGDPSDFGDVEYSATGRVTFLPLVDPEGVYLVHLGAAYSHRVFNLDNDPVRLRLFPSVRTGRYIFADTGAIAANSMDLANLQAAVKVGPVVLQSEYYHARVNDALIGGVNRNPSFSGWYVQATWLLTGEERPYRRTVPTTNPAVFDRPRPYENFFFVRTGEEGPWWRRLGLGRGAWEVGVRYCHVNLNDPGQGVNGQTYQDVTLGLNWYLTINTKIQWNYIIADRDFPSKDNSGVAHIFAVRFHHDFLHGHA